MGACCGGPSDPTDARVGRELEEDRKRDQKLLKLLLLGAGGSGKSTFFKQLRSIHGNGFSAFERRSIVPQIHRQILESMVQLVTQCNIIAGAHPDVQDDEQLVDVPQDEKRLYAIPDDLKVSIDVLIRIDSEAPNISSEQAKHLQALWDCDAMKRMFEHRNKLAIADSSKYFLDVLGRVCNEEYVPTDDDILLVRYRTTGMHEKRFCINQTNFLVVDVGGQRNERKKWINHFANVAAVLFVISLSCYDEVPFEEVMDLDVDLSESKKNNMLESLEVFETTLGYHGFSETTFILFLNKSDIMAEKINQVPITVAFPEYDGPQDFDASVNFIKEKFLELNDGARRDVFSHITCATDKNNVERVFHDVQVSLVNQNLGEADLL